MTEHGCSKCIYCAWDHRDGFIGGLLCIFYCVPRSIWHYYRCPGVQPMIPPSDPVTRCCMAPAPDRSGRTCDKPMGHDGEHWTYGGDTLMWPDPVTRGTRLRCFVTGNLCGTDTWPVWRPCVCDMCQQFLC